MTTIIENLNWRYATMKFDTSKAIPDADLATILEAGNLAATAYGLQPFQIVVITDPTVKESLVEHAHGQRHMADNSALIVMAARTDIDEAYITEYATRIETTRNLPPGAVDGYKQAMIKDLTNRTPEQRLLWAQKQSYIALGTMMAAASELRIDNHGLEGFNPVKFNEVLGLSEKSLHATTLLALGYRHADDEWQHYAKVRRATEDIVIRL